MEERDYAVEAESHPSNLLRLSALVRGRLREGGLHLYPDWVNDCLAQIVIDELVVLRKRAALMLDLARERYQGQGMSDSQLERAAIVILTHYLDVDGEIVLPSDISEE